MKRLIRFLWRFVLVLFFLALLLVVVGFFYMRQAKFGRLPEGERLARIAESPHFNNGIFHNLVERPIITAGYSMTGELYKAIFEKNPRTEPANALPSVITDLKKLPADSAVLVWFGHSSFYLQVKGIRILADPVFSENASPIPGFVKAYKGSNVYKVDDLPAIDFLLISHDHYDHLDYPTILALQPKVKKVVCGLGVGAHFEYWGYRPDQLIELDWGGKTDLGNGAAIYTESTHHAGGRGFLSQNKALWISFLIEVPGQKLYYSGDGGYDARFKQIYQKHGAIDWAIMECGQYNLAWQSVHELPEEVVRATNELHAKHLLPVHHSKFTLAKHPWDEPLKKLTELSADQPFQLATPMIGEVVRLTDSGQVFTQWWKTID